MTQPLMISDLVNDFQKKFLMEKITKIKSTASKGKFTEATNFIKNLTISASSTGLYDVNGVALSTVNIVGTDNYAYSNAIELSPKSIDHILTAICEGCTMEVLLQVSPDGTNWVDCKMADGTTNCSVDCTSATGDCSTKVLDVQLLQYARVKVGNAGSSGGTCTIKINFTLN